jgi:hypothetical protein
MELRTAVTRGSCDSSPTMRSNAVSLKKRVVAHVGKTVVYSKRSTAPPAVFR